MTACLMEASFEMKYPPELSSEEMEYLLSNIKDWSILNGLAVRPSPAFVPSNVDPSGSLAVAAPVTLFPSLFPRSCFDEARAIQVASNELYASIASDEEWLKEVVEDLIEVDDFIKKLWEIHCTVKKEGYVQDISFGLFRSDYMVHQDPSDPCAPFEIKQVEFNTIASSFGGLASKVSSLHSYLNSINAYPTPLISSSSLPPNPTIPSLAQGLATAHKTYGLSKSNPPLPLCVLFIVQPQETNIFDQLALSMTLFAVHKITTFYLPFPSILNHTAIDPVPTRSLIFTPPHSPNTPYEVSLLYFRAGYNPTEYAHPTAWPSRLHLERSAAIKCPSILTHLAGSKKIQQILAAPPSAINPSPLERFLPRSSPSSLYVPRILKTFAAIYPLDNSPLGQRAIGIATNPTFAASHVLKPQREGGGNNIYGIKIPPFLKSLGDDKRKWRAHILMELIEPPARQNFILRNGKMRGGEVIGELGVFGTCLWRGGCGRRSANAGGDGGTTTKVKILDNREAGYLLRTKGRESEEGGVAAGFGAVDSVCLM